MIVFGGGGGRSVRGVSVSISAGPGYVSSAIC